MGSIEPRCKVVCQFCEGTDDWIVNFCEHKQDGSQKNKLG
jgi:hypothetical protein